MVFNIRFDWREIIIESRVQWMTELGSSVLEQQGYHIVWYTWYHSFVRYVVIGIIKQEKLCVPYEIDFRGNDNQKDSVQCNSILAYGMWHEVSCPCMNCKRIHCFGYLLFCLRNA